VARNGESDRAALRGTADKVLIGWTKVTSGKREKLLNGGLASRRPVRGRYHRLSPRKESGM